MKTKKMAVYMGNCICGTVVVQRMSACKYKMIPCPKCKLLVTKLVETEVEVKK